MPIALVTGVAGFIGSNLAETLLSRGYTVRGIDNLSTGKKRNLSGFRDHENFHYHEGDIRNRQLMDQLSSDVEYVFHQAAIASVPESIEDPVTTTDVNATGTATVLQTAAENDVETVVVASSAAVYGSGGELPKTEQMVPSPESPYASSKRYSEELAQQFSRYNDLNTVALRYFNVYGPRQDIESDYAAVIPIFITQMLRGERPTIYGDGNQTRDFVHVDSVVEANIRAAQKDVTGEVINVATGEPVSVNDLVDTLNGILGTSIEPEYADPRPGDVKHSYADVSKAREVLDLDEIIEFQTGLQRTIDYYRPGAESSAE